jgi:hypothetical protein
METIEKVKTEYNIIKIKNDIKDLVDLQKFYKNQRKTVNLIGERKMQPWEASWKHHDNREKLRVMYATYAVARGRDISSVEQKNKKDKPKLTLSFINKNLENYRNV